MLLGQQFVSTADKNIFSIELVHICGSKPPSNRHVGSGVNHNETTPDLTVGKGFIIFFHVFFLPVPKYLLFAAALSF